MTTNLTDKELLDYLRAGPMSKKLMRERQERSLAERKDWAGEIEVLTAAHLKALSGLNAAVDVGAAGMEKAREALKEAEEAYRVVYFARSNATLRFDTQRFRLEARLRESAPAEIDAFLADLSSESDRVRKYGRNVSPPRRNPLTGEMEGGSSNLLESVTARLKGIDEARVEAEGLKLRALDREKVAAELDRIQDGIPQVEA